jgi:hypothetical protein
LIDESSASIQRPRSSPARLRVVFGWPVPLNASIGQNERPQSLPIDELFDSPDAGFETILKNDSELNSGLLRFGD